MCYCFQLDYHLSWTILRDEQDKPSQFCLRYAQIKWHLVHFVDSISWIQLTVGTYLASSYLFSSVALAVILQRLGVLSTIKPSWMHPRPCLKWVLSIVVILVVFSTLIAISVSLLFPSALCLSLKFICGEKHKVLCVVVQLLDLFQASTNTYECSPYKRQFFCWAVRKLRANQLLDRF